MKQRISNHGSFSQKKAISSPANYLFFLLFSVFVLFSVDMNKRLRTVLQYSFFLGLGIFLVWWSVKDLTAADKSQIRGALKTARYYLIIPVFLILILSHFFRA